MLRILKIKKETHTLGLKVSIAINSLKDCESLSVFQTNLKEELKKINTGNNLHADTLYKVKIVNQHKPAEVIHITKEHITKGEQIIFIVTK